MPNRAPLDPADISPIVRGVPPPPLRGQKMRRYPFGQMQPGDSFTVPADRAMSMRSAASNYRRNHRGWDFVTEVEGERCRIWRVK